MLDLKSSQTGNISPKSVQEVRGMKGFAFQQNCLYAYKHKKKQLASLCVGRLMDGRIALPSSTYDIAEVPAEQQKMPSLLMAASADNIVSGTSLMAVIPSMVAIDLARIGKVALVIGIGCWQRMAIASVTKLFF